MSVVVPNSWSLVYSEDWNRSKGFSILISPRIQHECVILSVVPIDGLDPKYRKVGYIYQELPTFPLGFQKPTWETDYHRFGFYVNIGTNFIVFPVINTLLTLKIRSYFDNLRVKMWVGGSDPYPPLNSDNW